MTGFLFISFIAGILTVVAPCILPLLPVIVGGSVSGQSSAKRATIIVASLGISVFLFTFILKVSTAFISIPELFWQILSGGLLIFFGIVTFAPALWERIPLVNALYIKSNKLIGSGYQKQNVWGDIIMGAALGPVFSSCSPTYFVILAAVLPANFAAGSAYLFAYVIGLSLFLLIISLLGQKIVTWLGIATNPNGWFKKTVGTLFVFVGIAVVFGIDKKIEAALPAGAFGEIGLEQQLLSSQNNPSVQTSPSNVSSAPKTISTTTADNNQPATRNSSKSATESSSQASQSFLTLAEKTLAYQKAPELVSPDGYINTEGHPVSIGQYLGKNVVLIDFWDYSCINCQRTIPYLNAWYEKYKNQGLIIVGVHTPEFAFEHLQSNVETAAKRFGISYPVVLDNEYKTWNAFQNQYWPREYLVDIDGYIVHDHAGEGDYDGTEHAIQNALTERAARLKTQAIPTSIVNIQASDLSAIQSPETYFGSARNQYLGNGTPGTQSLQKFTLPSPDSIQANTLYLGGQWNIRQEYAESAAGGTVIFKYNSRDVYMVATNLDSSVKIKVLRDGQPIGSFAGTDVDPKTSEVTINGDRLYKLIHDPTPGVHTIELQIEQGVLDAYTFTFG